VAQEATLLHLDGQVHHDTHPIPMGNYVIEVGKSVIGSPSQVGNYKIADIRGSVMMGSGWGSSGNGHPTPASGE
jgi:hypothetical protein